MLDQLRQRDGSIDPGSSFTWGDHGGGTTRASFKLDVIDRWTSPVTGATYPSRLSLNTTDPTSQRPVTWLIQPAAKAQELLGPFAGIPYWEAGCRMRDAAGNEIGSAYLELTGYAKELKV